MQRSVHQDEVDQNFDAFQRSLASLLPDHRGQIALMHARKIVAIFDKAGDAYREGSARFPDGLFSIQEITDEPIDLGFWSNVQH